MVPDPPAADTPRSFAWLGPAGPVIVAALMLAGVLATLDPAGSGPGVTCDEYYDVAAGKRLVTGWHRHGLGMWRRDRIEATYGPLTLHPPAGRWWLGWAESLLDRWPNEPDYVLVMAGRLAPALAGAVLVWLTGEVARRVAGSTAGWLAAAALATTPRFFGEAHQATLDTFTALTCLATLWSLTWLANERRPWLASLAAGMVWGAALLTKFHGATLVVPAAIWLAVSLGWGPRLWSRASLWLIAGGVVFWLGWPWLWLEVPDNARVYLTASTDRPALRVFYAGRSWLDRDVPWHYPLVLFLVTQPLTWLGLGTYGVVRAGRRWARQPLVLATTLGGGFFLVLFMLPGVPVYDGVRLFLASYPAWAVWVGLGGAVLVGDLQTRGVPARLVSLLLAVATLAPLADVARYSPVWLSHYNPLVGGLAGAVARGFEATYWGDSVTAPLLEQAAAAAPREAIAFAPHLAPFQAGAVQHSSPTLTRAEVRLIGWNAADSATTEVCRWALVYHRRAEEDQYAFLLARGRVVAETRVAGVWLARLVALPASPGELWRAHQAGPTTSPASSSREGNKNYERPHAFRRPGGQPDGRRGAETDQPPDGPRQRPGAAGAGHAPAHSRPGTGQR